MDKGEIENAPLLDEPEILFKKPQQKHPRPLLVLGFFVALIVFFLTTRYGATLFGHFPSFFNQEISNQVQITPSASPSPEIVPQATPELTPQPTPVPTPPLIEFGLYGIDYSDGLAVDYVTNVEISLYKKDGGLVAKKTSPTVVEPVRNNIGTTPSAIFSVPQGTYTYKAETITLVGSGEATLSLAEGPQYRGIALYIKPSTITGKLFVDKNNDAAFDAGDDVLANTTVSAFYFTSTGKALVGNSTTTNASGDFILKLDKYAGTYQLQTDLNLPYMYPSWPKVIVNSGQQLQQSLYLLPR